MCFCKPTKQIRSSKGLTLYSESVSFDFGLHGLFLTGRVPDLELHSVHVPSFFLEDLLEFPVSHRVHAHLARLLLNLVL